jgi:hypothetical protein
MSSRAVLNRFRVHHARFGQSCSAGARPGGHRPTDVRIAGVRWISLDRTGPFISGGVYHGICHQEAGRQRDVAAK